MIVEAAWKPEPKQALALACPAFEMLYGGSKGGMKTSFLVACPSPVLALADRKFRETGRLQKKCRTIMFRKNLEDLKDAIAKSFEIYPVLDPEMGTAGWHEKEKYWAFTSGATVEMRHLDGPTDHEAYNGNEFVVLLFDEVQFISYQAYSFLLAQVRSSDPDYRKMCMVRCTANPGGPYGDWVKRHFKVDEHPEGGKIFEVTTTLGDGRVKTTTRAFIRSYLRDNPHLDPDGSYEARLRTTMSADEVKMYLDGDFDCVSGAFFSSLLKPNVHFVKSKPIPSNWEMMFSIDWGSTEPACCLVGARDNDNRVWIIDEEHGPGVTGKTFGQRLATMWKHQKWCKDGRKFKTDEFWGVIDKQAMDRYGSESTAANGIQESGFRIFPADKLPGERKVGINGIKERLLLDKDNQPQVIIFEDRCPNLVRALKAINSQAPADPEDYADRSPLSHAIDAMRFMIMKWPVRTAKPEDKTDIEVARWNRILRKAKADADDEERIGTGYGD